MEKPTKLRTLKKHVPVITPTREKRTLAATTSATNASESEENFVPKHPLADCRNCPLYKRGRMVPSKPSADPGNARLAIVGEAPGNVEIARGEPFLGPSGQLLNASLTHHGVTRDEVLLTNATLCHYPQSFKKLPKEALEACNERLISEIHDSGAPTVIPMGNSAVQAVFPKDEAKKGITRLRAGRPKSSSHFPGKAVVPTFHPAACLRAQEKFPRMLTDLGKAIDAKNLPDGWYEPHIFIIDDSEHGLLMLSELEWTHGQEVVFDIETSREKDISFGNIHLNRMLCVGVGPTGTDDVYVFAEACFRSEEFRQAFKQFLLSVRVVAQNGKFDIGSLRAFLGFDEFESIELAEDTMLQSYSLFEYAGVHGLEYMGMELLGTPDWKHDIDPYLRGEDGKQPVDYANIPSHILHRYNAFDVHATRLLFAYFSRHIKARGLDDVYRFTLRVSNMLTLVEPRGIGFDVPYSQEFSDRLSGERAELERYLPTVCDPEAKSKALREPHKLNPDSPTQVTRYLGDHGVVVDSTEADVLEELLGKTDTEVPLEVKGTVRTILDIRGITKLDGTFVAGMRKRVTPDGTVNPSFLVHGTTSGRLSSRNPNSQNIPRSKDVKRQFIATPEHILVGVDMSQAELRVLTYLSKDENLREIFNDPNRDLFVELCRMVFPLEFPPEVPDSAVKVHELRRLLKTMVYGISYGRTAAGIAADPDFHMSVADAQKYMDMFTKIIPGVMEFQQNLIDEVMDETNKDVLWTPYGRRRQFFLITPQNQINIINEAKSFMPQSIASDIVLESACILTEEYQVPIVNLVHDAIYANVLKEQADEIANLISRVMIETGERITECYVRFGTDQKIGHSWADV
jgi:uracil-DNA glycosylase family 4